MALHILEIERSAEGSLFACLSKEGDDCGYRLTGPKGWGGSRNIATLKITEDDLFTYIKQYAPDVHKRLKADK